MKNRKRGFSLVELLIVLAVIAALIATITPVALNAIRKSKATQVAQNLKTLASAIENAAYVNGVFPASDTNNAGRIRNAVNGSPIELEDLGRDIDTDDYGISYAQTNGSFTAVVYFIGEGAHVATVREVLAGATSTAPGVPTGTYTDTLGAVYTEPGIFYQFTFDVY